ncbi:Isy1-like splicing factor [Leucosporidium creatinivorum]|uniref:Isy1-like splicing factor n=1 Tax=Leucosporidium creatinivorum TaxID=106004 RepID=A0A1Y2G2R7_9BASI|nr:Isy1-like splicing factor [Leucosporidium creatinivorum]
MARNEEKSQSMLFRFREAQAAELGLSGRTDRRPRVASSCKDLRQCERWRGEILREISRKVSKIQDFGLTDYEVRDINDEINKLLREKHHWENQIIALGGANYKRAAGKMTDGEGREVPGMRGYKYFGRAKELPGVKELFASSAAESAEAETYKHQRHDIFSNQGQAYYGDEDEKDGDLIKYEQEAEAEAWEDALENLRDSNISLPDPPPSLPTAAFISLDDPPASSTTSDVPTADGKRKSTAAATKAAKKAKLDAEAAAQNGNGFMSVLRAEDLRPPTLLTVEQMEKLIVAAQKKQLLADFVDE